MIASSLRRRALRPLLRSFASAPALSLSDMNVVGVNFTNENAQITIDLPTAGKVWFSVEPGKSVQQVLEDIHAEDAAVGVCELLDQNMRVLAEPAEQEFIEAIESASQRFYLRLNEDIYRFEQPNLEVEQQSKDVGSYSRWEAFCRNENELSYLHANTISLFLSGVEQALRERQPGAPLGKQEVAQLFGSAASFFDGSLTRKALYQAHMSRLQVQQEIDKLKKIKQEIDRSADRRTSLFFNTCFLLLCAQFGISYYAIYQVEWLGWDLLEPLTYTVAQGLFVVGVGFYCRYTKDVSYQDQSEFFMTRFRRKLYLKKGFEENRLKFLEKELEKINAGIAELERKKYF